MVVCLTKEHIGRFWRDLLLYYLPFNNFNELVYRLWSNSSILWGKFKLLCWPAHHLLLAYYLTINMPGCLLNDLPGCLLAAKPPASLPPCLPACIPACVRTWIFKVLNILKGCQRCKLVSLKIENFDTIPTKQPTICHPLSPFST